jgi:hypothetical protein
LASAYHAPMGGVLRKIRDIFGWLKFAWALLGWFGWTSIVTGVAASAGGAIWAVIAGVPIPIAIMAGYCTFVGAVFLTMAPMAYRALANAPRQKGIRQSTPNYDEWRQVEILTLLEAAYLWCGYDPHSKFDSPAIKTRLTIFLDAVRRGQLNLAAVGGADEYDMRGWLSNPEGWNSTTRTMLKDFAKNRGDDPLFLRDA